MHMTRRAPELSATSRLVWVWIIVRSLQSGADLGVALRQHFPGFRFRLRRALYDAGYVALLVDIGFIVCVVTLRTTHGLFQQRMKEGPFDLHDNGLVALVGDYQTFENSFGHVLVLSSGPV